MGDRQMQTHFHHKNTNEYKELTSKRRTEYTIQENLNLHPEVKKEFFTWRKAQKEYKKPTFDGVFNNEATIHFVDLEHLIISEDLEQRNALSPDRKSKIMRIAKDFDPRQAKPLQVDVINVGGACYKVIRDGGGTATAAYLAGLRKLPAIEYKSTAEQSRAKFRSQHCNVTKINEYTKFLGGLKNSFSKDHPTSKNIYTISREAGFDLDQQDRHFSHVVPKLSLLKRTIRTFGGDKKGTTWGKYEAPRLKEAVAAIKSVYPNCDEIPGNFLEGFTCFINVANNRLPKDFDTRQEHLTCFLKELEHDIKKFMSKSGAGSSNDYGYEGAISFMKAWEKVMPVKNRGRGGSKYCRFDEMDMNQVAAVKGRRQLAET
tara:strand:+ start:1667 stop:2785 length:1119 start_codon:yes stop_codon:yes gene_type:complete